MHSLFSSLDQTDRVCLSYRGFVKIIPEVAPLVPPIYTSESGKLSIGKPVKSVGREIKVFRTKQTRRESGILFFCPKYFPNYCITFGKRLTKKIVTLFAAYRYIVFFFFFRSLTKRVINTIIIQCIVNCNECKKPFVVKSSFEERDKDRHYIFLYIYEHCKYIQSFFFKKTI